MDLFALRTKVLQSHLLTDGERSYWMANLPQMTESQLLKLESILGKAETITWGEKAKNYLSMILGNKTTIA